MLQKQISSAHSFALTKASAFLRESREEGWGLGAQKDRLAMLHSESLLSPGREQEPLRWPVQRAQLPRSPFIAEIITWPLSLGLL